MRTTNNDLRLTWICYRREQSHTGDRNLASQIALDLSLLSILTGPGLYLLTDSRWYNVCGVSGLDPITVNFCS
jgi:hypothetical protein